MNKVISLIACISITVFAQNQQTQPTPPPPQQGQYQYPPPGYQYPPPQQQTPQPTPQQPPPGQYQYPPQGQYQYPPQGQYQYPPQQQTPQPTPQQPPPGQYQYPPQGQYQYPPQGQYQYPPQQQTQPPQPTPQQQPTQQMPTPQQQPPPPAATTPTPPAAAIPQPTPQQPPPQQGQYQYPPPQGQYPYPPQGQYQQYPPPPQYGVNVEEPAKQEIAKGMQFGVRAMFAMNSFSTGDSKKDEKINMGMGGGAGVVANFPITGAIAFSPEANFLYRTLFKVSESEGGASYEEYISEYAISIPLMLQIMPITGVPIHFAGGVQIDLPFNTIEYEEASYGGQSESRDKAIDDRRTFDFGIAVGAGYRILPNLEVDLRAVIGLTHLTTDSDDDSSLKQFGIGVNYFF